MLKKFLRTSAYVWVTAAICISSLSQAMNLEVQCEEMRIAQVALATRYVNEMKHDLLKYRRGMLVVRRNGGVDRSASIHLHTGYATEMWKNARKTRDEWAAIEQEYARVSGDSGDNRLAAHNNDRLEAMLPERRLGDLEPRVRTIHRVLTSNDEELDYTDSFERLCQINTQWHTQVWNARKERARKITADAEERDRRLSAEREEKLQKTANFPPTLARANDGDAECQFKVGVAYYKGEGVAKNLLKAREYFEKSAPALSTSAAYMGRIYINDEAGTYEEGPIHIRRSAALMWYRRAIDLGGNYQADVDRILKEAREGGYFDKIR